MKVLYKDEFENLSVMEVSKAAYVEEDEVLALNGPEDDIAVKASQKEAEKVIRELYETDKADATAYEYCEIDVEFDDDDDDDDYDDDEFDAMLDRILEDSEKNGVLRFK
ncbi:hypothetical protein AALA00_02285 [Lachnospiraceae bacterium 46-15]